MKANGASIGGRELAVERQLPCKLSNDELLDRGDKMAEAELQIDKLKADRRATNKQILEQVDLRNKLAHTIEAEEEMRVVVCRWHAIESEKRWELRRTDLPASDERSIVESRPMTAADLQGNLAFPTDESGAPVEPAAPPTELSKQIAEASAKLPKKLAAPAKTKAKAADKNGKGKSSTKSNRAHA